MLTCEERALVTEIEDRLIELYVQQDDARRNTIRTGAHALQVEIEKATASGPLRFRLPAEVRTLALSIVRERVFHFGPSLAAEKLPEHHGCSVSRET